VTCILDKLYCLSVSMPWPCVEVLNCETLEVCVCVCAGGNVCVCVVAVCGDVEL